MAIWVPSVTNQNKETETPDSRSSPRGYSSLSTAEELSIIESAADHEAINEDLLLENLKVSFPPCYMIFSAVSFLVIDCFISSISMPLNIFPVF